MISEYGVYAYQQSTECDDEEAELCGVFSSREKAIDELKSHGYIQFNDREGDPFQWKKESKYTPYFACIIPIENNVNIPQSLFVDDIYKKYGVTLGNITEKTVYGFITKREDGDNGIFPTLFTNVEKLHDYIRELGWEKIVSIKTPDGKETIQDDSDIWMEPSENRNIYSCENTYIFTGSLGIVQKFTLMEES